jgi:hypothetical protein
MKDTTQLPKYRCFKVVEAFRIGDATLYGDGRALLVPDIGTGVEIEPVEVDAEYMERHKPQIGGYYVRYEDGYESWSPAAAFEGGYTLVFATSEDKAKRLQKMIDILDRCQNHIERHSLIEYLRVYSGSKLK